MICLEMHLMIMAKPVVLEQCQLRQQPGSQFRNRAGMSETRQKSPVLLRILRLPQKATGDSANVTGHEDPETRGAVKMDHDETSGSGDAADGAEILNHLRNSGQQLVLAESCTAGLIAATLAETPGMSQHLCGSLVVYQIPSKLCWLGLPTGTVTESNVVSRETAERMAEGALRQTPHATLAVAITGHLGPGAPPELDGTAWVSILFRGGQAECHQLRLSADTVPSSISLRIQRQRQAVRRTLDLLLASLRSAAEPR